MNKQVIMTVISEDRPGIVESIAKVVSQHNGNWLESRLSRLAGKFAGIVQISVEEEQCDALVKQLQALQQHGISIAIDANHTNTNSVQPNATWRFSIMGNDRPGIIREVSQAFAKRHINLEELNSQCTSAPHSGVPLFSASGKIQLPDNLDIDDLEESLAKISDDLAIDIQLEQT